MRQNSKVKELEVNIELTSLPGHYIRRLQQIAVAIFLDETQELGITPVQYAALQAIANTPGIDQRTLAATIGFDTSTIGGVIDRLDARGLVDRSHSDADRRVRLLSLTSQGRKLLHAIIPAMLNAQERILAPLSAPDRKAFLRIIEQLVVANNNLSRAPSE